MNYIDNVMAELERLCAAPEDFFDHPPHGLNCANGFARFNADGTVTLEPHSPDHRQRYVLPGKWNVEAGRYDPMEESL